MTLKIFGGYIPDFNTHELVKKDLYIKNGIISAIGDINEPADKYIDATGRIVSPGFIDIHMHEETFSDEPDPYYSAYYELKMGVTTCVAGNCGNNRQSIKEFRNYIDKNGSPVNYMIFIGHNYLRSEAGISDRYRAATNDEIIKMKELVHEGLSLGIVGISYGIEYSPGISFDEMKLLAEIIEGKGYLLSAHFREDAAGAIESISEMIELSRATGIPMQISHIGSCSAYGYMEESLKLIEKARNEGIDVLADCYPYDAFATYIGSAVFDDGCFERWQKSYDSILLTEDPYQNKRCDKELFELARRDYSDMIAAAFVMNENEVIMAIKSTNVFVGSDSLYRKDQGHPRGAGSFPRVLGKYVREQSSLELVEALYKMTLGPAKRLNLDKKGRIEIGSDADIVIFDAEKISDNATFEFPTKAPDGIEYVLISGEIVVKENEVINGRKGKFIAYNPINKNLK